MPDHGASRAQGQKLWAWVRNGGADTGEGKPRGAAGVAPSGVAVPPPWGPGLGKPAWRSCT